MTKETTPQRFGTLLVAVVLAAATGAFAQRSDPVPPELQDVGITEQLGATVPSTARFVDENDQPVQLRDYMQPDRPVLLTLIYHACPMLCGLALNGTMELLKEMPLTAGQEFELVTISFDPAEGPELARLKKQNYLKAYPKLNGEGIHFLTGDEANIKAVTEAVGFAYKWNEQQSQFAHGAALMVLTPDGRISRYFHGVYYEPDEVRAAVRSAASGGISKADDGEAEHKGLLWVCFQYVAGENSGNAVTVMRIGGVLTIIVLAAVLVPLWVRSAGRIAPPDKTDG